MILFQAQMTTQNQTDIKQMLSTVAVIYQIIKNEVACKLGKQQ